MMATRRHLLTRGNVWQPFRPATTRPWAPSSLFLCRCTSSLTECSWSGCTAENAQSLVYAYRISHMATNDFVEPDGVGN
jgi:hypothetical protein